MLKNSIRLHEFFSYYFIQILWCNNAFLSNNFVIYRDAFDFWKSKKPVKEIFEKIILKK